ncbi:hypothetical protein HY087_00485, partial [Candidatus Gottesmanbacteria bacterium]|nr:hypothetical protein [Candidatus Gottesmanbacteria bacterium]
RLMWIIVLINYVLATIHWNNVQERYIATSVPLLFCIGAFVIVYFVTHILGRKRVVKLLYGVVFIIVAVMVAHDMSNLPHYVYTISTHTFRTPLFNQRRYEDTLFEYDRTRWDSPLPGPTDLSPRDVMTFITTAIDPNKPLWIDGFFNELSPGYFHMMMELQKEKGSLVSDAYSSYTVTVEVLPGSKFYTYDYTFQNTWQIPAIRARAKDPTLTKIKEKVFDQLGIRVVIYGK